MYSDIHSILYRVITIPPLFLFLNDLISKVHFKTIVLNLNSVGLHVHVHTCRPTCTCTHKLFITWIILLTQGSLISFDAVLASWGPCHCQAPIYTWVESGKCVKMSYQETLVPGWDWNPQPYDWESSEWTTVPQHLSLIFLLSFNSFNWIALCIVLSGHRTSHVLTCTYMYKLYVL